MLTELLKLTRSLAKETALLAQYIPDGLRGFYEQWTKEHNSHYQTIDEIVEDAKQRSSSDKVNLVCHSFGGLLGLSYTVKHPDDVKHCVTIATSFGGTPVAYLFPVLYAIAVKPTSAVQILPHSDFTTELQAHFSMYNDEFEAKGILFQNIRAKYDEFAPHYCTALKYLAPAASNIEECTLDESHVTIVHSEKVKALVEKLVISGHPTIFVPGFGLNSGLFEKMFAKDKKLKQIYEQHKDTVFFLHYDYTTPIMLEK